MFNDGAIYDISKHVWTKTPMTGAPSPRARASMVAVRDYIVVYGGEDENELHLGSEDGSISRLFDGNR